TPPAGKGRKFAAKRRSSRLVATLWAGMPTAHLAGVAVSSTGRRPAGRLLAEAVPAALGPANPSGILLWPAQTRPSPTAPPCRGLILVFDYRDRDPVALPEALYPS